MVLSVQQSRHAEFESYLTDLSKRSFSNLIQDYPRSDTTIQQRWKNILLGWKIEVRLSLLKYLSDNQAWRRIEYLFEEMLYFLDMDRPVLNEEGTDVCYATLPSTFLALVNNPHSCRFPSWISTSLPIKTKYRRLSELIEGLDEIVESFKTKIKRAGLNRTKLCSWRDEMEEKLLSRLWIDKKWEMIEFMLSEMLFEVVNGKLRNLVDQSGNMLHYWTAEGFLESMKTPWSTRFSHMKRPIPRTDPFSAVTRQ